MRNAKQHPITYILLIYLICFLFRAIEYLFFRTDQSIIGEAFVHKLIGIGLLALVVRQLQYGWRDIGFRTAQKTRGICFGLLFGSAVYAVAYGAEIIMQISAGNAPALRFYVTSYSIQGNQVMQDGATFILICMLGNIINVVMEEGIFRGLFVRLAEEKYSFAIACIFSSMLFGFWHIAQPVRNVLDGVQSLSGAFMMGLMLVATSALGGIQYVMLSKITGALWVGMAAHFVNNAIINLLHVVTATGSDEMQTIRIAIAQTLSFIIVFVLFLFHCNRSKQPQ